MATRWVDHHNGPRATGRARESRERRAGTAAHSAAPGADDLPDFLLLPERTMKPRTAGITHVLDKGLSLPELDGLLANVAPHVDFLKLGWGTAYLSASAAAKVARCREAGVHACLGGTLLEIAWRQDRVDEYVTWAQGIGIRHVEVSRGALAMPGDEKLRLIRELSREFEVLSEAGSKQPEHVDPAAWCEEMQRDLEAGAAWVVAEGRESGTVGLYEADGSVRLELVDAIAQAVPPERVVFEAPRKCQQVVLIQRLGPNVNLGNVATGDVLSVESLRRGLRADTIGLAIAMVDDDGAAGTHPR